MVKSLKPRVLPMAINVVGWYVFGFCLESRRLLIQLFIILVAPWLEWLATRRLRRGWRYCMFFTLTLKILTLLRSWGGQGLTGSIPADIQYLTSLNTLFLYINSLTGSIPTSIGKLTSLLVIHIHNNPGLTGALPSEMGNLVNLQELALGICSLTGSIPANFNNFPNLWRM